MDIDYNELREMVAKFSDVEVAPLAAEIDEKGKIPTALIQKVAENYKTKTKLFFHLQRL